MIILAIETSCDDTSVAIMCEGEILSNVIASQAIHSKWGGVVPELASREHVGTISQTFFACLEESGITVFDIDAIAVTSSPGLSGSLIVGTSFAKGLSLALNKPILPINHIEGHIFSCLIENPDINFPFISLVVSGGHTSLFYVKSFLVYEVIGSTIDDAAGEAYDKTAKMLGLGYPGGPEIDRRAKLGNPNAISFPRPLLNKDNYDFSFSGLKTSVRYYLRNNFGEDNPNEEELNDLCASIQAAINETLVGKTLKAAKNYNCYDITINGGVSANSNLRELFSVKKNKLVKVHFPSNQYSVDNAAMIALIGKMKLDNCSKESIDKQFRDYSFTVNSKPIRATK
ncbi:MAG: tRNA (adenosine(37)-N6)-threonylcarbamoyltransferase complex transferase subunit TsaD [Candidatus Kapaibacteriales bacterium]